MALVQCPDCKAEISDAAPACPKCGRPMAAPAPAAPVVVAPEQPKTVKATIWESRNGGAIGCFVIVLILAGIAVAMMNR
jgi:predicted amidophosphoribosyltransferase